MLTLIVLVLVLVVLTSMRLPDWLAFIAAIGAAIVARPYLPVFDFEANTDTIIAITVGLLLLPYWLGPLVIYATQRSSASPTFDAYDPARHAVAPSITVAVKEATVPALRKRVAWPAIGLLMLVMGYAASADTVASSSPELPAEPMRLSADFVVPADFPGAVRALEALTSTTAAQLTVVDSLGFPVKANGATVGVPDDRVESLLLAAQPIFLERGFYLFRHEPNYGIGGAPDEIGLVALRDQFAVVQLVGTNGANFDLSTTDVIAWLKALDRDAPFVLTGIGYDHIEGRFLRPVGADADSLAKRLHSFCPDVVDQGTGSVKELANEIGRLNTFFCWWD